MPWAAPHSADRQGRWRLPAAVLLLGASAAAAAARSRAADARCSLLGVWVPASGAGHCACDSGWSGATCAVADLRPLDTSLGYHNTSAASWGGRSIQDPATGLWSLIVSQFSNECPLALWTNNWSAPRAARARSRKRAEMFFGWVFFLISSGSPHVRPMGRTCGEPDEIELTAMGVKLNGPRCRARRAVHVRRGGLRGVPPQPQRHRPDTRRLLPRLHDRVAPASTRAVQ